MNHQPISTKHQNTNYREKPPYLTYIALMINVVQIFVVWLFLFTPANVSLDKNYVDHMPLFSTLILLLIPLAALSVLLTLFALLLNRLHWSIKLLLFVSAAIPIIMSLQLKV